MSRASYRLGVLGDGEDNAEAAAERVSIVDVEVIVAVAVVSLGMMLGVMAPDRGVLVALAAVLAALGSLLLLRSPIPAMR